MPFGTAQCTISGVSHFVVLFEFWVNNLGPVPNGTLYVHLRSYGLTTAATCACPLSPQDHRVSHSSFYHSEVSTLMPSPHWCKLAAEFYPTVKASLRQKSADSEEDREGLGCHLEQGLNSLYSFTTFYPQCILIHSLKHYFPQSNAENRRAGRESRSKRVWMRDAVYIFLISALTFISYIIYIKNI